MQRDVSMQNCSAAWLRASDFRELPAHVPRKPRISDFSKTIMRFRSVFSSRRTRWAGETIRASSTAPGIVRLNTPGGWAVLLGNLFLPLFVRPSCFACRFGMYRSVDTASMTACRALSDVRGSPFKTRETVAVETPASCAMSFTVEALIPSFLPTVWSGQSRG